MHPLHVGCITLTPFWSWNWGFVVTLFLLQFWSASTLKGYPCTVCNIELNSVEQYQAHISGSKHNNQWVSQRVSHAFNRLLEKISPSYWLTNNIFPHLTASNSRKGQMHFPAPLSTTSPISSIHPTRKDQRTWVTGTASTRAMSEKTLSDSAALFSFVTSFLCLGTGQCVSALCVS